MKPITKCQAGAWDKHNPVPHDCKKHSGHSGLHECSACGFKWEGVEAAVELQIRSKSTKNVAEG